MTSPLLGRLEKVELRAAWRSESSHFTPWLAQEENLALLAEAIGLDGLELQGQEQAVGPFRADILCKSIEDNTLVLIENQLERTDHGHLGQLLTYAAGLKAVTLVWIAERFTEEHRAALDWINEITDEGFHFFGLEIELWRIGDSPFAPKFNVVVQPNDWARTAQRSTQGGNAATPMGQMQVDYWASFGEFLTLRGAPFKPPKPYPSNWASWGLGRTGIMLVSIVNATEIQVNVDINSREHPTWFAKLLAQRPALEAAVGSPLEWDEKPGNKFSALRTRHSLDMRDRTNWPRAHQWMLDRMLATRDAFRPRAMLLDDAPPPEDARATS